jgi:hypothetical protein
MFDLTEQEKLLALVTGVGAAGWWLATVLFVAWRNAARSRGEWKSSATSYWDKYRDAQAKEVSVWSRSSDAAIVQRDRLRDDFIAHLKEQVETLQKVVLPCDGEDDE